ncbi:MFS transporter [Paenibacillus xerothermodurans]|uniref:MFS transporter n=1 Tax=Paenibacillus xerothermodurans TaxID=1977292 RepID=A0A2W1NLG3_PAEXE|nr:MFS transporter [Paenibacillus xerothermodurans]PZE19843.1 MFS transporter [Paenibacillus xerothermodurans]
MKRFVWASYGMYSLGGMAGVLFGAIMPQLLQHYAVSYTTGGFIVFLQAVGFMSGVPLVSFLMGRSHYRHILIASAAVVAIAQLGMLTLPPIELVYVLAILNGIGISAVETAVASYIMEAFIGQRAVFMSRLEVAYGLGALGMPLLASAVIVWDAWRIAFLIIGGFALLLVWLWNTVTYALEDAQGGVQLDARTAAPPNFSTRRSKYAVLSFFLFMIFVYVGVEGSLNSFLSSIFVTYLDALPYYASLSVSVFWLAMVLGRLAIGWVAQHLNYERYLLYSILASLLSLIGLSQVQHQFAGFVVIFSLGVAMSAVYSITMVYANHTFPGMERTVTSLVTAFAGIGGAVFPAVVGYAMDHLSPASILWLFIGFAGLLLGALLAIFKALHALRRRALSPAVDVQS